MVEVEGEVFDARGQGLVENTAAKDGHAGLRLTGLCEGRKPNGRALQANPRLVRPRRVLVRAELRTATVANRATRIQLSMAVCLVVRPSLKLPR